MPDFEFSEKNSSSLRELVWGNMFAGDGAAAAGEGSEAVGAVAGESKPAGQEGHVASDSQLLRENERLRQELAEARDECKRLKELLADKEEHKEMLKQDEAFSQRYWTPEEHQRFLTGLKMYGHKDIKAISRFVGTRNATQVWGGVKPGGERSRRSHASSLICIHSYSERYTIATILVFIGAVQCLSKRKSWY